MFSFLILIFFVCSSFCQEKINLNQKQLIPNKYDSLIKVEKLIFLDKIFGKINFSNFKDNDYIEKRSKFFCDDKNVKNYIFIPISKFDTYLRMTLDEGDDQKMIYFTRDKKIINNQKSIEVVKYDDYEYLFQYYTKSKFNSIFLHPFVLVTIIVILYNLSKNKIRDYIFEAELALEKSKPSK